MFSKGGLYKHRNFLDVVMQVTRVQYRGPSYWKMKTRWFIEADWIYLTDDVVKVKTKDFKNWRQV